MLRKFHLRLQSLILLALIPTLLVVTALYGYSNYSAVYRDILQGFDRKLQAVGSSSAAFIDGGVHERLIRPREIQAIAYDTELSRLVGIDRTNGYLVTLDTTTGSAEELLFFADQALARAAKNMTFDAKRGRFAVVLDDGRVMSMTREGTFTALLDAAGQWRAIAYAPQSDVFYAVGSALVEISADKLKQRPLAQASLEGITGLVYREGEGDLIALRGDNGEVLSLTLDGATGSLGKLPPAKVEHVAEEVKDETKQWTEPQLVVLPAHGLAQIEGEIFASTDRLIRVSTKTGEGDPKGFRMGFRSDVSPLYRGYAVPMKRIMEQVGLTYHYTIILPKEDQLIYVLDGTDGEDHSQAGTEEDVESGEWRRLQAVMTSGEPSQSDVQSFDIWGLLKVGTTPIRDSNGEIVGLVGADVNISEIQKKTRVALLEVLLVGALSLILATMAAFGIARRLISPIQRLKEGALKVAAGRYERPIEVKNPRELKELSQSFNEIRRALSNRIATLEKENAQFEERRCKFELMKVLGSPSVGRMAIEFFGPNEVGEEVSGFIEYGSKVLVWLAASPADPLKAAFLRTDIASLAKKLLQAYSNDWPTLRERLERIFREEVSLFVLIDASTNKVQSLARRPTKAATRLPNKAAEPCVLIEHSELILAPGASLTLGTDEKGEADVTVYGARIQPATGLNTGVAA